MHNTIKDKVKTQIQINQHLVNYSDSDSDSFSQNQPGLSLNDLPRPTRNIDQFDSDDSDIDQHQIMNQRRKIVLQNLNYSDKQNILHKPSKLQKSLKQYHSNQQTPELQNQQIVDLKSKIAQLLKELQLKSSQINELQTTLSLLTIKIDHLESEIEEKSSNLTLKQQKITSLSLQNKNLSQNYQITLKQFERQFKKRTDFLNDEVTEINNSTFEKDKQIDLLTNLIKLKDQEIQNFRKTDSKAKKCIIQNQKLKSDLKRLITLFENTLNGQKFSKSTKNFLSDKMSPFKPKKERSKSFTIEKFFLHSKVKAHRNISSNFDSHYASLPSKGPKNERLPSDWVPKGLINQVQAFLKKWRIAQNNKNFVNSLVSFINSYTESCLRQAKSKMDNQYKQLKKQIQRKANQSLAFGEIIKERELKIKLNNSQNKNLIKSPLKQVKDNPTKLQNLNLTSQNVSILVPASNKKFKESRKNNFLCGSLLLEKTQKDDIGYINLEKSMKIHRQTSTHAFNQFGQTSDKILDQSMLGKKPAEKDKRMHCRTELSVKSSKKSSLGDSNKKNSIKSVSHKKNFDFPFKKYKIL